MAAAPAGRQGLAGRTEKEREQGVSMKVLVSACLVGRRCRYDATARYDDALVEALAGCEIVPTCPEVEGGLRCPRPACEMRCDGRIVSAEGLDATDAYVRGALRALEKAKSHGCGLAVLKAKSPSCGVGRIYDGTFSGRLVEGDGVTARMLRDAGIAVVDEDAFVRGAALSPVCSKNGETPDI